MPWILGKKHPGCSKVRVKDLLLANLQQLFVTIKAQAIRVEEKKARRSLKAQKLATISCSISSCKLSLDNFTSSKRKPLLTQGV
jgi:hypothetical protein